MALILILALFSALGVRISGTVVRGLALAKILLLGTIIAWGFASSRGAWSNFSPFIAPRTGSAPLLAGLASGIIGAFFSFGGFWDVAKIGSEIRDPTRILPRALAIGVGVATVVYILTSGAFIRLVPIEAADSGPAFAAQAGTALFGSDGGRVFAAIVLVAVAGSLAAVLMTAPRVYYAMARDGLFPGAVGRLHPRFGTPVRAIALQALLGCVVVGFATFDAILAYFICITVAFLALTVAGLYRLPRPAEAIFRVPGYPVTPAVFLALLLTLIALLAGGRPYEAAFGAAIVALGYPVYRFGVSRRRPRPQQEAS
jgi:APA family basic amino acid/polyamine antiporter